MPGKAKQAAAIPFRRNGDGVCVCLITTSTSQLWTIPKGTIEAGFSPQDAALQEAREEAGLTGTIVGELCGTYEYEKWGQTYTVATYLMEVTDVAEDWDEREVRERRWLSAEQATHVLKGHPACGIVAGALRSLMP